MIQSLMSSSTYRRCILIVGALLITAGMPSRTRAQQLQVPPDWRVEPSVGMLIDRYDAGADGSRAGSLFGLQVARRISGPLSGIASLGYARVNDVSYHSPVPSRYHIQRNDWIFASLGPAVDLPAQRATISLSLQVGAAWRRTPVSGAVGEPMPDPWLANGDGFSVRAVILPSASVHYPVARHVALSARASAYVLNPDEWARTSPALALGLSFMR